MKNKFLLYLLGTVLLYIPSCSEIPSPVTYSIVGKWRYTNYHIVKMTNNVITENITGVDTVGITYSFNRDLRFTIVSTPNFDSGTYALNVDTLRLLSNQAARNPIVYTGVSLTDSVLILHHDGIVINSNPITSFFNTYTFKR